MDDAAASNLPISIDDVAQAAATLRDVARRTPLLSDSGLDAEIGCRLFLKPENLQVGGAFKFRGAYNCISQLDPAARRRGILAHSSGNHGIATVLAAELHNAKATIVVPSGAVENKVARIKALGGTVVRFGHTSLDVAEHAAELVAEHGYGLVHAFDDPTVVAGAGTVGLELAQDFPAVDAVVVQASGGGLCAGTAVALKALRPEVELIAAEPVGCPAVSSALNAGEPVTVPGANTIADGMRVQRCGDLAFEVLHALTDDVIGVSDDQTLGAMGALWRNLRLAVEPSGAVALAAACDPRFAGKRVAVTVSGGNVELATLARAMNAQLTHEAPEVGDLATRTHRRHP